MNVAVDGDLLLYADDYCSIYKSIDITEVKLKQSFFYYISVSWLQQLLKSLVIADCYVIT